MTARVFVVGCPRSGTTLVQSVLAAHSAVTSFTESHFFDKGFYAAGMVPRRAALAARVRAFARENGLAADDLAAACAAQPGAELARRLIAWLDQAAAARGAACWVEKTPDHVFRLGAIAAAAPDARFVHVVRRPEAVLPSLRKASRQWGRGKSWLNCAAHWAMAVQVSARHAEAPDHLVLTYEAFVQDTASAARRLFDWLGLAWEPAVLTDYAATAERLISPGESWKADNRGVIRHGGGAALRLPWDARALVYALGRYHRLARQEAGRA